MSDGAYSYPIAGTRDSYDRIAASYRERFAHELDDKPFDRGFLDKVAALTARSGWLVDLGSGPGQIGAYLVTLGARVVSVDLSFAMLQEGAALVSSSRRVQADMRALPFTDNSIGGIVAFYSLIHIPSADLAGTITELGRALTAGGLLALATHATLPAGRGTVRLDGDVRALHVEEMLAEAVDLEFYFYGADDLIACLELAGFELLEMTEREPLGPEVETQTRRAYCLAQKRASASVLG